jgi:enterochelin esterase family protein
VPRTPSSPEITLHPLLLEVARTHGSVQSLDALRAGLAASRGPLTEPATDGGITVTFVWIGEAPQVSLQCGLVNHGNSTALTRIPGTEVWTLEVSATDDTLVSYRYVVDDPFLGAGPLDDAEWQRLMLEAQARAFADPHNPRRLPPLASLFGLAVAEDQWESVLSLPAAPDASWFSSTEAADGSFERFEHVSAALGDTRDITIYVAPGPSTERPLVVLLDGPSWLSIADLPRAVDAAVHAHEMASPIVAFVHQAHGSNGLVDRVRELSCNPQHARMLADELIPFLRSRYRVAGADHTVLGGASLGGLASMFTAMEHPHVVHNVLSVSGSFWFGLERDGRPEWLTRQLAEHQKPPRRVYQQIGRLEDGPLQVSPTVSHLAANRHFRDVATANGIELTYEEMGTAHDIAAFRIAVMRGLITLLPRS